MTEDEMKARIAELEASETKLKADKQAALGEKNKANRAAEAAQEAADAAAEDAARKANDLEGLEKSLEKKYSKQIANLTSARDEATKHLNALVIDGGIKDALTANGVPAAFVKPLTAMLKAEATLEGGAAVIGGVSLADYAKTYFASDEGAAFVTAPNNSGAGATGSASTGRGQWTKPPVTGEELRSWDRWAVANQAEANAQADRWNAPHLKV